MCENFAGVTRIEASDAPASMGLNDFGSRCHSEASIALTHKCKRGIVLSRCHMKDFPCIGGGRQKTNKANEQISNGSVQVFTHCGFVQPRIRAEPSLEAALKGE